jgi:hypothetical protein
MTMSRRPRYRQTGKHSFFGDFVYERIVGKDHFLVALKELFDWDRVGALLILLYKGKGMIGRPPWDPTLVFKMLFLSYLYGVSERAVEQFATYHLAAKCFLDLAVDERPPDHTCLTKFKKRLIENGKWQDMEGIYDDMIQQAIAHGIEMGEIQVVDSVHTKADVNYEKDRERQKKGKSPRDPQAQVVHKGKRTVVEPDGKCTTKEVKYKGYKTHTSSNAKTGIVTSIEPSLGGKADNKAFPALMKHDQSLGLPTTTYGGDRAYDDTDIHERVEQAGMHSGFRLHQYRTQKKDENKQRWLDMEASPEYQAAIADRFRVEQPYGTAKQNHNFGRCRYLGFLPYRIQSYFTFLVVIMKRMVKLLTGITFRPLAKGRRAEVFTPVYASLPWA